MLNIKNIVLAFLLGLSIGIFGGWHVHGWFVDAHQVEKMVNVRKNDAKEVQKSQNIDKAVTADIDFSNKTISDIRKKIKDYAKAPTIVPAQGFDDDSRLAPANPGQLLVCTGDFLSRGQLWMLNSARAGTLDSSAIPGDAEGKAPSSVAVTEFIDNDLEVVGIYHELAKRHDALVDYVNGLMKAQRERLGISNP